ncbi:MAG: Phosphoribosylglycinamide formyltransferase [Candidatus Moanabacter tarae]|uniref:Phosphoribosylglycinamide formyltransferase n=1 Tax=Candidatus Moanibacter tarae TaxID=2200854 RepID=A0A2Z4AJU6_9BACT|nr:MAG: Phosphoribosylglycinamide formyltransferase [Candidatus Moanabacter tarae]
MKTISQSIPRSSSRLGILGSTKGTDLQAIIGAIEQGRLDASVAVVISNKRDAYILERARKHDILTIYVEGKERSRKNFDDEVSTILKQNCVDLVLLIGYMRILSPSFIDSWNNRVLNVHPSLLPEFGGSMDLDVHSEVLKSGVEVTGCTVHIATKEIDAGPIIVQKCCTIADGETSESLKVKVQALEGEALIEAIQLFQNGFPLFSRG